MTKRLLPCLAAAGLLGLVGCNVGMDSKSSLTQRSSTDTATTLLLLSSSMTPNQPGRPAKASISAVTFLGNTDTPATVSVNGIMDSEPQPQAWVVKVPMGTFGVPVDPGKGGTGQCNFGIEAWDEARNINYTLVTMTFLEEDSATAASLR